MLHFLRTRSPAVRSSGALPLLLALTVLVGAAGRASAATDEHFGSGVSLSGDELAVLGATTTTVYARQGGLWTLKASLPLRGDEVAIADHHLAVGYSAGLNGPGSASGVSLFAFDGTAWRPDGQITTTANAGFTGVLHNVLAISGDVLAVGGADLHNTTALGTVDLFTRNAGGGWTFAQELAEPTAMHISLPSFGYALALQGDTLLVGAPGSSAYGYRRSAGTWVREGQLLYPYGPVSGLSGYSVGLDGDRALVGSFGSPVEVYQRTGSTWNYDIDITTSGFGYFGPAVKVSGQNYAIFSIVPGSGRTDFFYDVAPRQIITLPGVSTPHGDDTLGAAGYPPTIGFSGSTFVIGAPFAPDATGAAAGEVDIYTQGPYDTLAHTATITQVARITGGLVATDIGSARPALGGASGDGTAFTLAAGGTGIGGTADDFRFVPTTLAGDGEINARVALGAVQPLAQAGLMLRDDTTPGASFVAFSLTQRNTLLLQWRRAPGLASQALAQITGITGPVSLRLVRHGDTVTASYSLDGTTFTAAGQTVVQLARPVAAGAAVCGYSTTVASSATFTGMMATPYGLSSPLSTPLAFGTALPGSGAETSAGLTTVAGGGADFGDPSDAGEFLASAPLPGDFDLRAQVLYQRNSDGLAKAGLMVRSDTAANAANLFAFLTPSHGGLIQRRSVAGGTTVNLGRTNNTAAWYRITRTGTQVATFWSLDGATWQPLAGATIAGPLLVGPAVCSHNAALLGVATFANLALTSPDIVPVMPQANN